MSFAQLHFLLALASFALAMEAYKVKCYQHARCYGIECVAYATIAILHAIGPN
jgi:hypothetical protein